jgi:hypothetical protein
VLSLRDGHQLTIADPLTGRANRHGLLAPTATWPCTRPNTRRPPGAGRDLAGRVHPDRRADRPGRHRSGLEITESAVVDTEVAIPALRALREGRIRIAIDDFGTGYSSLQYLTRLPVGILKIDRSFVGELDGSPEGSAVTEAVIRLGRVLRPTTVADGIETREQATQLPATVAGLDATIGRPANQTA